MNPSSQPTLVTLQNSIRARKGILGCGPEFTAALHSRGRTVYTGADRYGQRDATAWEGVFALVCTPKYTAALLKDGTLCFAGTVILDSVFLGLSHVRTIACGEDHMAALLGNGRVIVGGNCPWDGRCHTSEWSTVTDVVCGKSFTLGLTPQGGVAVAGGSRLLQHILGSWRGVAGIFTDAAGETVYGITDEGRLLATRPLPRRCREWKNLIFVAANRRHIWGVTASGQLLSTDRQAESIRRSGYFITCAVSETHAVCLTRDGRVLAVGHNEFGECDTHCFGTLFSGFEERAADRRADALEMAAAERAYQVRLSNFLRYQRHIACGEGVTACIAADGRVMTTGAYSRARAWDGVRTLACGNAHIVALHEDGRVSADGNDTVGCAEVSEWSRMKSVVAGKYHTLGLTEEGTVCFCGHRTMLGNEVAAWSGIRRLYTADSYAVGVDWEGNLYLAGEPPFSRDSIHAGWKSPLELVLTNTHMAALYPDGRVLSTVEVPAGGKSGDGDVANTCNWHYVRAIAAGEGFTLGLCYGGRVESVSSPGMGVCDTSSWRDVVAIGCGKHYAAGLTASGRMLIACTDRDAAFGGAPLPDVSLWKDVLTFCCGPYHLVALTSGGQVLSCGLDTDRQCSGTTHFTLFRDARQLYGYGQYSQQLEMEIQAHRASERTDREPEEEGILPFRQIAPALREDTHTLLSRLTGSDAHLTVLDADGRAVTYLYENAGLTVDKDPLPAAVRACADGTVLLYADGKARKRELSALEEPLSPLPDRLGDSHFYPVKDVAFGDRHRVVLLQDGTLRAYGENDRGQGDVTAWSRIAAVACGSDHTVGLRKDGTAIATGTRPWEGSGRSRGVAHSPRANPCAVEGWRNVVSLSCAGDVTVGLTAGCTVYATGSNQYGQCDTRAWEGVVSVATSGSHTVALFGDGRVRAVGLNESGECRTESWRRVVQIQVMPELTLGLRADGRVLAAGRHSEVLKTLDAVRAIACFGSRRQVFVLADGTLRIHNRGSEYLPEPLPDVRLFRPSVEYSILHRVNPRGIPTLTAKSLRHSCAMGMAHTVTLGKGGHIHAVGEGENGQCDVRLHHTAVRVAAGPYHTAVILADGLLAISGRNSDGQCDAAALNRELDTVGITTEEARNSAVPTQSTPPPDTLPYAWQQVSCGYNHTAALRSDGRVYAVGANPDGRCDTRKWREVTGLSCGVRHTLAVLTDGTCVATGDNRYGQCDVSLWKGITLVAAGEFHSVGLRADGRVEAVGDNRKGQCRVEDLRDIISVACLPEATLCIRADGRVIIRGGSGEHDKTVEALREAVALCTCEHRLAALTVDGRLVMVGR